MGDEYKELHERVHDLRSELEDKIEHQDSALAIKLKDKVKQLDEDMDNHEDPDRLEELCRDIAQLFKRARAQSDEEAILNPSEAEEFRETYEDMRQDFRDLEM